jgi:uncharacterized protein
MKMRRYAILLLLCLALSAHTVYAASDVVISQVYGGGGNSGATLTHDFIELFNRGTVSVSLTNWSVQYASTSGTSWQVTPLSGTIAPGQYYLVQQAQGAGGTTPLPTPDAIGTIAMAASNGKVALVSSTTALTGSCPAALDFVGYGTANCFEGTGAAPALTNTTAAIRALNGCQDTDNNDTDFATGAPSPRNSASPTNPCSSGGNNPPTINAPADPIATVERDSPPFTVSLTGNDDGGVYNWSATAGAGIASVEVTDGQDAPTATFTVLLSANYTGTATFTASLSDNVNAPRTQTVNITVTAPSTDPPPPAIVISQVYGGGGNSGATFTHDFIELFNPTSTPVSVTGWSVQYASSTGTSWNVTSLSGSIPPGRYYLVQQAAGSGGTTALPAPDAIGSAAMAAGAGKVALVSSVSPLTGACPTAGVIDFVGYGSANCFEGSQPAPAPSNTNAIHRARGGCRDTDDNRADFSIGLPTPRNSASPERSCIPQVRSIPEIQGSGASSPFEGVDVTTTGIVTALKQNFSGGSYSVNGFFMQSAVSDPANPDSDGNPATSEGIFVFTSTPPPVYVGDVVTVNAAVVEYFGLTQLSVFDPIVVISSGNPLPHPITLDSTILDPAGMADQLERLEGMRVHAPSVVSVSPTDNFGEIYTVLSGVPRTFREPGIDVSAPLPDGAPCCVARFDGNPERLMINSDGIAGSSQLIVTSNVTISGVTGPLDFTFGNYKILPEGPLSASANMTATPVPAPLPNEFTIASYNMLNLWASNANFSDRLNKASLAIRNLMHTPDIIGVAEVFDIETLVALAERVNSDAVAAGDPDPRYEAHLLEGNDRFANTIDVGLLVRLDRVEVDEVFQRGKDLTFTNPTTGSQDLLFERPPLVLRARIRTPAGSKFPVTVISNHLQSLIDTELTDARGARQREKRRVQAEFTANLAQELQSENLVLVGDFNAYQFNDGYVDVIGTIKGTPAPAHEVVLGSIDLVDPDLTALVDTAFIAPDQRYSYVFNGNAQALDHVIVDSEMLARTTRYVHVRANADFPTAYRNDPSRVEGSSDHDMPVAFFCFPFGITSASVDKPVLHVPNHQMVDVYVSYTLSDNCFPVTTTLSVTSNEAVDAPGSGNTDPDWEVIDANRVRLRAERAGGGTGRIYTITITATDTRGHTVTEEVTVTVPR